MASSKRTPASVIALGGMLAALAVVIMSLGTALMIGTYACPMLVIIIQKLVLNTCGKRIAWAWYAAVAILSALLAPDKEAAAVFLFLGYYPMVKPWLDRRRFPWVWKLTLFNGNLVVMYWLLMNLLGLDHLAEEFFGMGIFMLVLILVLGNMVFYMLDRILGAELRRRKR